MQEYDDIDLRPYLAAVARRWYWIVGLAVLAALIVAGVSMQLPQTYTATSSVLLFIRQTGSQVGVNEPLVRIETIDIVARRQGILALAKNPAIEAQIRQEDLERVAPASYAPGSLTKQIAIDADGDLLTISASAPTPQQAQALADLWTNTFVSYADTLYTDEHSRIQIVGKALPPVQPSSPQAARNALFAALMVSLAAVPLVAFWSQRRRLQPSTERREQPVMAGRKSNGQPVSRVSASQTRGD